MTKVTLPSFSSNRRRYSRFVSAMKWVLPAGAGLIVLSVFIASGTFDTRDKLAITFREIETVDDDRRMVSPKVTGVDSHGRPYTLVANTATQAPDNPNRITMENIEADLLLDDGGEWLSLTSRFGLLNTDMEEIELWENIRVFSSEGYRMEGATARIDFNEGTLKSDNPVYGQGPLGTLEANGMEAENDGETIRFTGGVKMVIFPGAEGD